MRAALPGASAGPHARVLPCRQGPVSCSALLGMIPGFPFSRVSFSICLFFFFSFSWLHTVVLGSQVSHLAGLSAHTRRGQTLLDS